MARREEGRGRGRGGGALGLAVVALALAALALPVVVRAHVHYVAEVPNSLNLEKIQAVGHQSREGGGALNPFGKDFKTIGSHTWNRALCEADSDGDGESNGLELGDPCCIWSTAKNEPPTRKWQLSHPGDAGDKSGVEMPRNCTAVQRNALGDEKFWEFYYSGYSKSKAATETWGQYFASFFPEAEREGKAEAGRCGFRFGSATCEQGCCNRDGSCTADAGQCQEDNGCQPKYSARSAPCAPRTWGSYLTFDLSDSSPTAKYKFTFLLALLVAVFLKMGTWREFKEATWRKHLAFMVVSYAFVDVLSGLLHITLDNPAINHWPLIGPEAQSFQGHHYDPSAIARGGWFRFLQTVHAGQLLATLPGLLHLRSGPLRMFLCWVNVMIPFMMAAHRWSHVPPSVTPMLVKVLQFVGILITPEWHSVHHAHFDSNFSILGGWTDPFLNLASRYILSPHNPAWAFSLVLWGVVPAILSYQPVYRPVLSRLGSLYLSVEGMLAEHAPAAARRLRWLSGRNLKNESMIV